MSAPADSSNIVYLTPAMAGETAYVSSAFSGGGGGGDDMNVSMKEYVDLKSELSRAQTDVAINGLGSKIDNLDTRLDALPTKWTIWGAVGAGALGLLAVLAFAGDRFDGGVGLGSSLPERVAERVTDTRAELNVQSGRIDDIESEMAPLIATTEEAGSALQPASSTDGQ